ncbi:MAG: ribonuclease P protein component [Eubacteriales bacterium]|nr:ribonuclease P protein component [Eubacteriales bacterium]
MLNEVNRLTKRKEFGYIYKHGKYCYNNYLTLMYVPTKLKQPRIGFSVSKKTGKAWLRNKTKRQLRDIVRKMIDSINPCYNYVFITKPEITTLDYNKIKEAVVDVLTKANLVK